MAVLTGKVGSGARANWGGRSPRAEGQDRRHHQEEHSGTQVCVLCVCLFWPGQIPQKNPSAAPTSCPLTALHTFRGFRTSITGGCPVGEGGTPHSFPYPGGLHLEPVTRQDPTGFGVSRLEKPRPHSYTPITRPRHWPLSAAHSAPCGRGRHRPATARQPQELTQKGRAPQNPV